ncbi:acyl-CoA dehydrogenase family protein [Williamsia muralis]|uniref:acyl-CoA dehydrogenase family protein n=1 Tax=Williamsia marianensis TaxID=85044 RepID=UPI0038250990
MSWTGTEYRDEAAEAAALREVVGAVIARSSPPARIRELDARREFDQGLYEALGDAGLIGLDADLDARSTPSAVNETIVLEELGAGPTSMAVCLVVQYMGLGLLTRFGDSRQRESVLAPLIDGKQRIAFALSEPDGGTDVARAMTTSATQNGAGKWTINGTKTWISGPRVAGHLILLARTAPLEEPAIDGITMFLVPVDTPGVTITELDTLAIHGLDTCEVSFADVELADGAVLGEVGAGFRQVLHTLNSERLNAAAVALGIARGALCAAVGYADQRQAFGRSIGSFQASQHRLVDNVIQFESARLLLRQAADAADNGRRSDILGAMAKVAASDAATCATDVGMRLMAGAGFSTDFDMERLFRDARLYTFAPLTDDMLRNHIGEKLLGLPRSY